MKKKPAKGHQRYAASIPGDRGNYHWSVAFDISTNGYLGVTQDADGVTSRVLLSPKQAAALMMFLHPRRRVPR